MAADDQIEGYSDEHRPLGGYAILTGLFGAAFAGSPTATARSPSSRAAAACGWPPVSCSSVPICVGGWVASGFGVGLVTAPRLTRLIMLIYSAEAISDFLQLAYLSAEERS